MDLAPMTNAQVADARENHGLWLENQGQPGMALDAYFEALVLDPGRTRLLSDIRRAGSYYVHNKHIRERLTAVPRRELRDGAQYICWNTVTGDQIAVYWNEQLGCFFYTKVVSGNGDPQHGEEGRAVPYVDERQMKNGWKGCVPYVRVDERHPFVIPRS